MPEGRDDACEAAQDRPGILADPEARDADSRQLAIVHVLGRGVDEQKRLDTCVDVQKGDT